MAALESSSGTTRGTTPGGPGTSRAGRDSGRPTTSGAGRDTGHGTAPARDAERPGIATGEERDRYLDLLRAFAICTVVLGHWLLAVVWVENGRLRADMLLAAEPVTQWITWLVQVMPVFFVVGGVVNARSWRSARERGDGYATWVRGRSIRLLRPTIVLLWFWVAGGPLLVAMGMDRDLVALGARNAFAPLWFLATYLVVAASVPLLIAVHDRLGLRFVLGLVALVAVVDVAHHELGVPLIGNVNFFAVWAVPTVIGFCWHDGLLQGRLIRWVLPLAAFVLLVLLVTRLGYPVSLVGVDEADRNNNAPPSLALAALALAQTGVVLAARSPLTRWLERPLVWRSVGGLNLVAMTIFLWHMTVMVLAVPLVNATVGWPQREPLTALWWALRPLWIVGLALALAGTVAALARVELRSPDPRPQPPGVRSATLAAGGILAAVAALVILMLVGVVPEGSAWVVPVACTLTVTVAAVSLGAIRPRDLALSG